MKVVAKHIVETKRMSTITLYELDELDDGRYVLHRKNSMSMLSAEEFDVMQTTQIVPLTSSLT